MHTYKVVASCEISSINSGQPRVDKRSQVFCLCSHMWANPFPRLATNHVWFAQYSKSSVYSMCRRRQRPKSSICLLVHSQWLSPPWTCCLTWAKSNFPADRTKDPAAPQRRLTVAIVVVVAPCPVKVVQCFLDRREKRQQRLDGGAYCKASYAFALSVVGS